MKYLESLIAILTLAFAVPAYATSAFSPNTDAYSHYLANIKTKAEDGDPNAESSLGMAYSLGHGIPKDDAEAVKWYRKAADQGNARGQLFLGSAYSFGRGVQADKAEGAKWWRKAAEQGEPNAETFLGIAYYGGNGVPKDQASC